MTCKARIAFVLFVFSASAAAQEQTGKIIFYRESHFRTSDYKPPVFCDGVELARMDNGSFLEAIAPPGRHVCVVESVDGPPVTNEIAPGNVVYLRVEIRPGIKRHAFLTATPEAEYQQQKKLKQMPATRLTATQPQQLSSQTSLSSTGGSGTSPSGSALRPGVGGLTYPGCTSCPDPKYTPAARDANVQGTVVLQAVIGQDGVATGIRIIRGLGLGLDEQAVNAVQSWKFSPAHGPNGDPVATIVPIEITFRLLRY